MSSSSSPSKPIRILYIEDDPGLARLFQRNLEREGYEVALAADGEEGLEAQRRDAYDVLAVDYKMPVYNGLEVVRQLAAEGALPPTIMLTAMGDETVAVEAMKLGVGDYLVKDNACGYLKVLPSVIERLLERQRLEEAERLATEARVESERRFRAVAESASEAIIWFQGDDGRICFWNRSAETICGYSEEEAQGRPISTIIPKRYQEFFENEIRLTKSADRSGRMVEVEILHRDGTEVPAEVSFSSWRTGGEVFFTLIIRDITERKRGEAAMRESARLEATSTLAEGIAHQFSNLLFGVQGNLDLLRMRLEDRPDAVGRLGVIQQLVERSNELIDQLLAFAHRGRYQPRVMDLNQTVQEAVQPLESSLAPGVRVDRQLEVRLWKINADPTQITQVVMNLCRNAAEAMDGREGTIALATRNTTVESAGGPHEGGLEPGAYVTLTVEDDGCGMSSETQARVFEPFFTTKFQGRGLGLAAVYGIVTHHGGHIEVESRKGEGTRVAIHLPAVESELRLPTRSRATMPSLPRGGETLLIIDEDAVFLSVAQEFLEVLGYRVLTAAEGFQALALARNFKQPIHLTLLQSNLASMAPGEAYAALVEARPEIRVVLTGHQSTEALARPLLEAGAEVFLRKPFGLDLLAHEVRRALDRP